MSHSTSILQAHRERPYLHELTCASTCAAHRAEYLGKHVSWLRAKQSENGGYAGREGDCDLTTVRSP